ncbi:hypothetical protein CVT26_010173 [Gymnopilus dilepis]|uniref:EF-hand domain-containing protein n=1 Tax=Gymnopilus dilepis TaxID=231916 RepID=A0A409WCV0_9AGAR|nr:hypothetical protein CVT26_010173 [Gymnopilus dilepis]
MASFGASSCLSCGIPRRSAAVSKLSRCGGASQLQQEEFRESRTGGAWQELPLKGSCLPDHTWFHCLLPLHHPEPVELSTSQEYLILNLIMANCMHGVASFTLTDRLVHNYEAKAEQGDGEERVGLVEGDGGAEGREIEPLSRSKAPELPPSPGPPLMQFARPTTSSLTPPLTPDPTATPYIPSSASSAIVSRPPPTALRPRPTEEVKEVEDVPIASAGFSLLAPQPANPSSTSSSSRFILNPSQEDFVADSWHQRAPSFPAVDSQGNLVPPLPISPKTTISNRSASRERRKFGRSWSGYSSGNGSVSPSGSGSDVRGAATTEAGAMPSETRVKKMRRRKKEVGYEFKGSNDIVGIVMLEIQDAEDLSKISNSKSFGFVVFCSCSRLFILQGLALAGIWIPSSLFHSLNPTWDEKLLFHVRRYETAYKASFNVKEVMEGGIQPDPETGLYKAKYQPYDALRQRFWCQYLQHYDCDNANTISHLELTAMLDSFSSTLTQSTLASSFTRFNKDLKEDELTIDEAVMRLKADFGRPVEEKRRLDEDTKEGEDGSFSATPVLPVAGEKGEEVQLDWGRTGFSGPPHVGLPTHAADAMGVGAFTTEPMQLPLHQAAATRSSDTETPDLSSDGNGESGNNSPTMPSTPGGSLVPSAPGSRKKYRRNPFRRNSRRMSTTSEPATPTVEESLSPESHQRQVLPSLPPPSDELQGGNRHHYALADCASEDWKKFDKIMVGIFVTSIQPRGSGIQTPHTSLKISIVNALSTTPCKTCRGTAVNRRGHEGGEDGSAGVTLVMLLVRTVKGASGLWLDGLLSLLHAGLSIDAADSTGVGEFATEYIGDVGTPTSAPMTIARAVIMMYDVADFRWSLAHSAAESRKK